MTVDARTITLGEALSLAAARVPNRPALLSEAQQLTWSELDTEVNRLANLLRSVGVEAGDAVGFIITKRPEVVTGFLACARIGAIMAPVNFKLHPDQVRDQLVTGAIRTLFVESALDP